MQSGEEARDLHQRGHCPAHQNVRADEPAHRHGAVGNPIDAPDDHAHGHGLRDQRRDGDGEIVVFFGHAAGFGRNSDHLFPEVQHPAFGHARLESLQPVDQFDKQRILLHVLLIALLRRALAGLLQHDARNDKHGNGAQRQNHQRAADISQQEQSHNKERQVDERQERRGAEKFAQRLEFAQVVDQRAGRFGLGVQPHGQHFLHQTAGKHDVRVAARHVDEVTAQVAQQEIEKVGYQDAYGQHPERIHRVVGNHAVVHVHHEQGADDADQVDDHAGEGHMPINRHVVEQDVPEPALPLEEPDAVGPLVKPGLARGENGVSRVLVRQHLKGDGLHALPRFRENHSRLAVIQGRQDARAVTGQQKDTRKHQRGNVLKALPINDLPLKPRTLCRVQAGPGRDTPRPGQPRHQKCRGNGLAAKPQQRNQTVHQRRNEIHVRRR